MEQQVVHKTFKYKLKPTPEQARAMEFNLRRCRELYNAALQERRDAWQKCNVSITIAVQSAQLPAVKAVRPEYRDIHSQVLQDVLTRLDRAFQAFFRRIGEGQTPGYPRFQGTARYNSFTYKQFGNGAALDNGFLVLSKIGRLALRWSRPLEGAPKTVTISREADGWYVCFSSADVPIQPLPAYWAGDGDRLGFGVLRHALGWHDDSHPAVLSQGRATAQDGLAPGFATQEGEPPPQESGKSTRQGTSEGEAPAAGLPPQSRPPPGSDQRRDLSRGLADGQHGQESLPCEEHF